MAQKPANAMKKLDAKENYFIAADSPKLLALELRSRFGGNADEWEKEVNLAISQGTLIFARQDGKTGYRTRKPSERPEARNASVRADSNKMVEVFA